MTKADREWGDGLSPGVAMVERVFGVSVSDYLLVIENLLRAETDPAIVVEVASTLRSRLLLAERAQHDDEGIGMGGTDVGIGEDGGLDVVDLASDRNPTQAA